MRRRRRTRADSEVTGVHDPILGGTCGNLVRIAKDVIQLHQHRPQTAAAVGVVFFGRSIPGAKSPPSIQTRHGRQGETKGDKAKSSQPSIQTCHGRQGEPKGISAQHPDMPWETRGAEGNLSPASRHAMGDNGRQRKKKQNHLSPASRHAMGDKGRQRAGIILAQHHFYARIESPSPQSCLGKNLPI